MVEVQIDADSPEVFNCSVREARALLESLAQRAGCSTVVSGNSVFAQITVTYPNGDDITVEVRETMIGGIIDLRDMVINGLDLEAI